MGGQIVRSATTGRHAAQITERTRAVLTQVSAGHRRHSNTCCRRGYRRRSSPTLVHTFHSETRFGPSDNYRLQDTTDSIANCK